MAQHHYLDFKSLVGKSLRYIAEMQGQWVAMLGWSAAALKCEPSDTWIGWPPVIKWQRLHLIANHARFLITPHIHLPNLASKALSLNLKRLSKDLENIYGHPLVLAETFLWNQGDLPAPVIKHLIGFTWDKLKVLVCSLIIISIIDSLNLFGSVLYTTGSVNGLPILAHLHFSKSL